MSSEAPPLRRKRRWTRILAWQLAVLVVGLVLAELGFRLLRHLQGKTYRAHEARAELEHIRAGVDSFVVLPARDQPVEEWNARYLQPYYGWEFVGGGKQIEQDLTRVGSAIAEEEYEVLLVGGSVAAIFGNQMQKRFQDLLAADPRFKGRRVHLYKYGRAAFKQPQQVGLVHYLLSLGLTPEAVLSLDGFNEIACANDNAHNGNHPIQPWIPQWGYLAVNGFSDRSTVDLLVKLRTDQRRLIEACDSALRWNLSESALLGKLALMRLFRLRDQAREVQHELSLAQKAVAKGPILRGPPFDAAPEHALETCVRTWEESSRTLRGMCEARGIYYVHVLQPTLNDIGAKPKTPEEEQRGVTSVAWREGAELGYPLLRASGARLAREGELFLDASRLFADVTETLYNDPCHFTLRGNELLADWIAADFLRHLPAKDPRKRE